MIGGGLSGFSLAFNDLLYPGEMIFLIATGLIVLLGGFLLGQLKLLSRDLRGSELVDVVWGFYPHLNRIRHEIAAHLVSENRRENR